MAGARSRGSVAGARAFEDVGEVECQQLAGEVAIIFGKRGISLEATARILRLIAQSIDLGLEQQARQDAGPEHSSVAALVQDEVKS